MLGSLNTACNASLRGAAVSAAYSGTRCGGARPETARRGEGHVEVLRRRSKQLRTRVERVRPCVVGAELQGDAIMRVEREHTQTTAIATCGCAHSANVARRAKAGAQAGGAFIERVRVLRHGPA